MPAGWVFVAGILSCGGRHGAARRDSNEAEPTKPAASAAPGKPLVENHCTCAGWAALEQQTRTAPSVHDEVDGRTYKRRVKRNGPIQAHVASRLAAYASGRS